MLRYLMWVIVFKLSNCAVSMEMERSADEDPSELQACGGCSEVQYVCLLDSWREDRSCPYAGVWVLLSERGSGALPPPQGSWQTSLGSLRDGVAHAASAKQAVVEGSCGI